MTLYDVLVILGYGALGLCVLGVLVMGVLFILIIHSTVVNYLRNTWVTQEELDILEANLDREEMEVFRCRLDELGPCRYQGCPWGVDFTTCPELREMTPDELRREAKPVSGG